MMTYKRVAVASTFSPTFAAVLAEADRFARQCQAELEIIHVADYEEEKEVRFHEALGRPIQIRWLRGATPADAIAQAAREFSYDLVIAGALQREDGDKPFTSGVARELLRKVECDLLLLPGPSMEGRHLSHVVFVFDPGEDCADFMAHAVKTLGASEVTIAAAETPFAAALANSRGESPCDARAWSAALAEGLQQEGVQAESWIVTSNTGYSLCEAMQGVAADLMIVQTGREIAERPLPVHVNWLYQVIPMRLLVVR